jgi:phosphoserine phosphatase
MKISRWQLEHPVNAVVFDCDGTLSMIEGIDELARSNGVSDAVESLTAEAMNTTGINPSLYEKRLDLVYPKQEQVLALGHHYFKRQAPDVSDVIQLLKRLNKMVYVVSAGLYPAVRIFGELLQVPPENIFAVDIQFDDNGHFVDFERTSPLITRNGKRDIVNRLRMLHPTIIHIGDGMNDYVTYDLVTRFIGYGGAFYRENMAARCKYYINTLSLAPLLPLSLTQKEYQGLGPAEKSLYQKGVAAIHEGKVTT